MDYPTRFRDLVREASAIFRIQKTLIPSPATA